jgi:RNA polymerase sporulation-specific sigma factor
MGTDADLIYRGIEEELELRLLGQALTRLSLRERQIMNLRFGLAGGQERTQKEVADSLGISQSYISRLEKRIIKRLRRDMERMA